MKTPGLATAEILVPRQGVDLETWSVIACDQYTSQPDYWQQARDQVGRSASSLHLVLPEMDLDKLETAKVTIGEMTQKYLADGTLVPLGRGAVYVRRHLPTGVREGLVTAIDLEAYDYSPDTPLPIRATEGTVAERLPARAAIRALAEVECPHILMLFDDASDSVFAPLRQGLPELYSLELMLGGGQLEGYFADEDKLAQVDENLAKCVRTDAAGNQMSFAVGDGNHSLAAALSYWRSLKSTLTAAQQADHPARYALVELINLHCPAVGFEPIHRLCLNGDAGAALKAVLERQGIAYTVVAAGADVPFTIYPEGVGIDCPGWKEWPLGKVQSLCDEALTGMEVDYIHGEQALIDLSRNGATGVLLGAPPRSGLFDLVLGGGVCPKKTFSLGEADEKRFYLECRKIIE